MHGNYSYKNRKLLGQDLIFAYIILGRQQHRYVPWTLTISPSLYGSIISIIYAALPYLWARIGPTSFVKQREIILSVIKVFYFSAPLLRRPRGIQRVLDAEPRPGKLGVLIDTIKVIWGCRLMAILIGSSALPSSLLLYLPVLLYSTLAVRGNKSLCETELLSHPITAARIAAFHSWADRIVQPVLSSLGFSELFAVALNPKDQCEAYLNWMYAIVGLVLPTIVVVRLFPSILSGRLRFNKWLSVVEIGPFTSKSGGKRVLSMVWWLFLGEQESRAPWDWWLLAFGWWFSFSTIWSFSKLLVH
jgi:hypothetical protein